MLIAWLVFCVLGVHACHNPVTAQELLTGDRTRFAAIRGAASAGDLLGRRVSGAGDCNGDGFDDVVLSAPFDDTLASDAGAVYLVFGRSKQTWALSTFDFSFDDTPDTNSWIRITGMSKNDYLGAPSLSHGDFNGDGFSDIAMGAASRIYVVFGHSSPWSSFNASSIGSAAVPGFRVVTSMANVTRYYLSRAGDANGDGVDDLLAIVTADGLSHPSVFFGQRGNTREDFNLSNIDGTNGFHLVGGPTSVAIGVQDSAGDFNGDGLDDIALGGSGLGEAGRAYVVFAKNVSENGEWSTDVNLVTLDGNNGVEFFGSPQIGWVTVGAGDLNNDGFDDIFLGSSQVGTNAWVVFGHATPWTSPFDVRLLNGTNGFSIAPSANDTYWGASGGSAGDVNGDGVGDLVFGAYDAYNFDNTQKTGAVIVIFGHHQGVVWPAKITRNEIVGPFGFQIDGIANHSFFGRTVRGAGDLNGDGIGDIVIGAHGYNITDGFVSLVFGVNDGCSECTSGTGSTSDLCLVCRYGFALNGTVCEALPIVSSSHVSSIASTSTVIMETDGSVSVVEVTAEIAELLGVDATTIIVVEVTPGTFEITVSSDSLAQQLVTAINQCMNQQ